MIGKKLADAFKISLIAATAFRTIPFTYNPKTERLQLAKSPWHLGLVRTAQLVVAIYIAFLLVRILQFRNHGIPVIFNMVFMCIMCANNSAYLFRMVRNKHSFAWLFDNVKTMNERYNYPIPPENQKEKSMSTWPQTQAFCIFLFVVNYIRNPHNPQYIYSALPEGIQNPLFWSLNLLSEFFVLCSCCNILQTELFTQAWVLRSLIVWTEQCTKVPTTVEGLDETLFNNKVQTVVTTVYNSCFGKNMEQFKQLMSGFAVFSNYAAVKHHSELPIPILGICIVGSVFCSLSPSFFYGEAYKIYDNTLTLQNKCLEALRTFPAGRLKYNLQRIKAIHQNRIIMNGLYYIDRMMPLVTFHIVLSCSVSMLLMKN